MIDREEYLENIRRQFAEEINEAYLECLHPSSVDYAELSVRLDKLMKLAVVEGLPEKEFVDLVRATLPDAHSKLGFGTQKAAA